jgi:hypothetical protein
VNTKLTRIRIEAHGDNAIQLRGILLDTWERARNHQGGEWIVEDEEYLPSKEGTWGRLTMRLKEPE